MSNSLDPDQVRRVVGPDLGTNCLPRLSADGTGRQRVNQSCGIKSNGHIYPEELLIKPLKVQDGRPISLQHFIEILLNI